MTWSFTIGGGVTTTEVTKLPFRESDKMVSTSWSAASSEVVLMVVLEEAPLIVLVEVAAVADEVVEEEYEGGQ